MERRGVPVRRPRQPTRVSVPVLVVYGTADQSAFRGHARGLYEAVPHDRKELRAVTGATHYLQGQPELTAELADGLIGWMESQGLRR